MTAVTQQLKICFLICKKGMHGTYLIQLMEISNETAAVSKPANCLAPGLSKYKFSHSLEVRCYRQLMKAEKSLKITTARKSVNTMTFTDRTGNPSAPRSRTSARPG